MLINYYAQPPFEVLRLTKIQSDARSTNIISSAQLGDNIYGKIEVDSNHEDLILSLEHFWATRTADLNDLNNFLLFENSNPHEIIEFQSFNGNSSLVTFTFPAFRFAVSSNVWFHAIVRLCHRFKKYFILYIYIPLRSRKAGRAWCGGARETH